MAAILLDTTVIIDLLRGRGDALRRLEALRRAGDVPYVCAINVEELWRGARGNAEEKKLIQLLEGLRVVTLGSEEGERAGRWRRDFARKGVTLGQAACLIAAAAVAIGAPLATSNTRDFPMPELVVEDWAAP